MLNSKMELGVYYQNVRGLKTKTEDFRVKLLQSSYDVIILCETWLHDGIFTSELFDERYVVYRKDRDNSSLGGWDLCTDLWIAVDHVNGNRTFFNVKYIESKSSFDKYKLNFDKMLETFMLSKPGDNFVLTGHYNLNDSVTWSFDSDMKVRRTYGVKGTIANGLIDTLELCGFNQFNNVRNVNARTLDLVISNLSSNCIEVLRSGDYFVPEDKHHPSIAINVNLSPLNYLQEKRRPKTNFFKANYVQLNSELSKIDWLSELGGIDVNGAVSRFYEILDPFIALIPKTIATSRDYPVYYSYELISLLKKKANVKCKLKSAP